MPTTTVGTSQSTVLEQNRTRVSVEFENPNLDGNIYLGVGMGRVITTTDYDYKIGPGTGKGFELAFDGFQIKERWVAIGDMVNLTLAYKEMFT